MKRVLYLLATITFGACSFDTPAGITCDSEGEVVNGRVCQDGLWIRTDEPDMATDGDVTTDQDLPDQEIPDQGQPDQSEDMPDLCVPETQDELCERLEFNCGETTAENNCGETVPIDCGTCDDPLVCGINSPNVCGCSGTNEAALCATAGAECGMIEVMDPNCGVMRMISCGPCQGPESCGAGGENNQCACVSESEEEFCMRLGAACGSVTALDNCNIERTYNCGGCTDPQTCGGGGTPNQCGCSEATICDELGYQCGTRDISLICPNLTNDVVCGSCGANGSCDAGNLCVCDTGYTFQNDSCQDINECSTNNGGCDSNATCANTAGGFTCSCNAGFSGDGFSCSPTAPTITQTVEGTASGASLTVSTASMTNNADAALFIAFVSVATGERDVTSVEGLGLLWSQVGEYCNRTDTEILEVWSARGVGQTGTVTATLSGNPFASAITVLRVDGADPAPASASAFRRNQNTSGCGNGGNVSESTYSFDLTYADANALAISATSTLGATHTPGAGWTAHSDVTALSFTRPSSHYVMTRTTDATGTTTVSGTFGVDTYWANITVFVPRP